MKTKHQHKSIVSLSLLAAAFAAAPSLAAPPPLQVPLPPISRQEPPLLDANQRRGIQIELSRLSAEVLDARIGVKNDPSLAPIKEKIAVASTNDAPDSATILTALKRELDGAEMKLFSEVEGLDAKRARVLELGRLLEYDTQFFRDLRRRQGHAYLAAEYEHAVATARGGATASAPSRHAEAEDTDDPVDAETEE